MQDQVTTETVFEAVLHEPERWALFLDIDGTLVDLALTPDGAHVVAGLPDQLDRISARLGGALALVTGRSLEMADQMFAPYRFPTAGLHGAEIRAGGKAQLVGTDARFEQLKLSLAIEAEQYPGVVIEDKGGAVAAHYRLAPEHEALLGERMKHYAELAGPDFALQLGKMVYEIRPARSSKGDALERFFLTPPFTSRLPIAIGDDLTDESMFAVTNARGGLSARVGGSETPTCAAGRIPTPEDVRRMIARLAG